MKGSHQQMTSFFIKEERGSLSLFLIFLICRHRRPFGSNESNDAVLLAVLVGVLFRAEETGELKSTQTRMAEKPFVTAKDKKMIRKLYTNYSI